METLGVPEVAAAAVFFSLLGAFVEVVEEHPERIMAATAIPDIPVLNLFIVLFIDFSPLFFVIDGYSAKQ